MGRRRCARAPDTNGPRNPKTAPFAYYLKLLQAAAPSFALTVKAMQVSNAGEIEAGIDALAQQTNAGLIVLPDVGMYAHHFAGTQSAAIAKAEQQARPQAAGDRQ